MLNKRMNESSSLLAPIVFRWPQAGSVRVLESYGKWKFQDLESFGKERISKMSI